MRVSLYSRPQLPRLPMCCHTRTVPRTSQHISPLAANPSQSFTCCNNTYPTSDCRSALCNLWHEQARALLSLLLQVVGK